MGRRELQWDDDAVKRLNKAPFFVRKIARGRVEKAARDQGVSLITLAFVEQIKQREMGQ